MNKKTIIISALVVLGLAGIMFWGRNNQTANISQNTASISSLVTSEMFYDFGTISMANGNVDHVFKVVNSTDKDVNVKAISTSCMCTNAYIETAKGEKGPFGMVGMGYIPPANEIIKAGESRNVRVVYDPNAHGPAGVGSINRLVYLTDATGENLQLEIKATVTP